MTSRKALPYGMGRMCLPHRIDNVQLYTCSMYVSGVTRFRGGGRTVVVLRDDNRLGVAGNVRAVRPDLVPGVSLYNPRFSWDCPVGQECEPYFNPAAFMRPIKGMLGNAPRTFDNARWPSQQFFDLSIQKN